MKNEGKKSCRNSLIRYPYFLPAGLPRFARKDDGVTPLRPVARREGVSPVRPVPGLPRRQRRLAKTKRENRHHESRRDEVIQRSGKVDTGLRNYSKIFSAFSVVSGLLRMRSQRRKEGGHREPRKGCGDPGTSRTGETSSGQGGARISLFRLCEP